MLFRSYQDAEKRTLILLSIFKYPLGTPVDDNPGIQLMSEDVSFAPGIKSGKEYLRLMERNLTNANAPMELQGEPVELSVAGQVFYRRNALLHIHSKIVYEAIVVTILKEHALAFVFVAGSEDARTSLVKTLETVRFESPHP